MRWMKQERQRGELAQQLRKSHMLFIMGGEGTRIAIPEFDKLTTVRLTHYKPKFKLAGRFYKELTRLSGTVPQFRFFALLGVKVIRRRSRVVRCTVHEFYP